jgi:hypothetical protein
LAVFGGLLAIKPNRPGWVFYFLKKVSMKTRLIIASSIFLIQIANSYAQVGATAVKAKPPAIKPKPPAPAAQLGTLAQEAARNGVVKCANRVDQHERFFLQQKNEVGALMFVAPQEANDRLFSMSLEIIENNESAYVSSTYMPARKDGCSASYDIVKYWPGSCQEVATQIYSQFGTPAILKKQVTMLGTEPYVRVFLMAAGAGCVSIKKEIVF